MALVLTLKQGDYFTVGNTKYQVYEVFSETHYRVKRLDTGEVFDILPSRMTEVDEDVMISAGDVPEQIPVRLNIDAPKNLHIQRQHVSR